MQICTAIKSKQSNLMINSFNWHSYCILTRLALSCTPGIARNCKYYIVRSSVLVHRRISCSDHLPTRQGDHLPSSVFKPPSERQQARCLTPIEKDCVSDLSDPGSCRIGPVRQPENAAIQNLAALQCNIGGTIIAPFVNACLTWLQIYRQA